MPKKLLKSAETRCEADRILSLLEVDKYDWDVDKAAHLVVELKNVKMIFSVSLTSIYKNVGSCNDSFSCRQGHWRLRKTAKIEFFQESKIDKFRKKKVGMKEHERLLAENQEALIHMFDRNDMLQNDFKHPPGLKFNFDEKPIRLSSTLHPYILYFENKEEPPNIMQPSRYKNATFILCTCEDEDHLPSILLLPSKIPKNYNERIAKDFIIVSNDSGQKFFNQVKNVYRLVAYTNALRFTLIKS
ncbi:MAG: hypothetical protein EZS28_034342 [Streblomastix strix]|uniref:Uncharacterized protein n=1 Tax=Streblomastix strix TaxID=222440 RepID=A0A5J4UJN9_9EUKA|nr:MAG: hypothetical protein EZS28_034342 [Streblomastix strix]